MTSVGRVRVRVCRWTKFCIHGCSKSLRTRPHMHISDWSCRNHERRTRQSVPCKCM